MQTFKYYAVVTPDLEDDCYLVRFPDLKNVFTDGETLLETVKHAEEVLEGMLEVMIDYNTKFNPPSPVSDLKIEEGESLSLLRYTLHLRERMAISSRNSSMVSMPMRIERQCFLNGSIDKVQRVRTNEYEKGRK
ncbi:MULTISPECIES: type II toxin-antitoxin system HicB family antitoxin [unclassified Exiguobacterium]|uniref:type II toxin-antitoxin system HicB family antitoxin n=1 Tax=unclassified Exiguobacterium TaxID=2644629 RepID=UPI001BE9C469|nr:MULTISPECIES: type II toxin-antitoxin system HicB family antitoxin [unclassified Exiguobacterium]